MLESVTFFYFSDAIDVDVAPNSSVTVVSESRMEVEGRAVIVVKKPRVKLSPEERVRCLCVCHCVCLSVCLSVIYFLHQTIIQFCKELQ